MTPEEVDSFVKANFPCSHEVNGESTVEPIGWCPMCGAVKDSFALTLRRGDMITQGKQTRYAIVHNNTLYFYEQALVDLGLLEARSLGAKWQSVEEAQKYQRR